MARIREGVRKSTLFSLAWSITGGLLVIFGGQFLTQLFVGESDAAVLQQSQFYLNIMGVFLFPLGQLFIYRNVLQGMGRGGVPVFVGFVELAMRAFAAFCLTIPFGYLGVCLANPVAWIGAAIPLAIAYFYYMHKIKQKEYRLQSSVD